MHFQDKSAVQRKGKGEMSTTSPIRKEEDLQRFRNYYLEKGKMRNYLLIVVGLNTALCIGDVLSLQWKDVYDYKRRRFRAHLQVVEQKTGKTNQIALNDCVLHALRQCYNGQKADEYLFYSACHKNQPISRSQAWRIVRQAAEETGIDGNVSCHSLRKTFGYHAWKQGVPPAMLMMIYNHSSYQITKRYLGIIQEEKDDVFYHVQL